MSGRRWMAGLGVLCALLLADGVLAAGPWRANRANTPGWQWLTPAERLEHQARIRTFGDYDECVRYRLAHRQLVRERARASGQQLGRGRDDFCAHLPRREDGR